MSFDPDTLTLKDELDRLDREIEETLSELDSVEPGSDRAIMLRKEARDLDAAGQAVAGLIDQYSETSEVRVRGLNAGEYAEVENRTADAKAKSTGKGGVPGTGKLVFAAAGLLDAPFYDGDVDDMDSKIQALTEQPVGVRKWIEGLVSGRGADDSGNWRSLRERITDTGSTT